MRLALVLLAALALAGPAAAGDVHVHLGFLPGKLTVSSAQTSATAVNVTVADGRGSGAGWTLSFTTNAPAVSSIVASCARGSTCTLPRAASGPSGSTVLRAASGTGMGVVRLTIHLAAAARVGVRVA